MPKEKEFKCEKCGETFKTKEKLKEHVKNCKKKKMDKKKKGKKK